MTGIRSTSPPLGTATEADIDKALTTLCLAFSSDPLNRWMFPDPQRFLTDWFRPTRAYCGRAFEHGTAHYADGFRGVATWLPPGVHPDEDELVPNVQASIEPDRQEPLFELFQMMADYEPDEPFWYLLLLGVDPMHQRQGIGTALLQHGLQQCDRESRKAYLVSSDPANTRLYQRHGFEVTGTIQVDTAPPVWPMVRSPQQ